MSEEIKSGHWKNNFQFDHLGSHDHIALSKDGKDLIAKIISFHKKPSKDLKGKDCIVTIAKLQLQNGKEIKPMIINKTNFRALIKAYKSEDIADFIGKYVAIFIKPNVMNGESGLRFREFAPSLELPDIIPSEYERAALRYLEEGNMDFTRKHRKISAEQETAIIELSKTLKPSE